MVTLRCTKALLKRIGVRPQGLGASPTCALGNWFANIVHFRSQPLVMAVSERAFIPVFFPARELREYVVPAFHQAVSSLLTRIGAAQGAAERELSLMVPTLIAPTNSRQVLGVMNQYAFELRFIAHHKPLLPFSEIELHFASGLAGPLGLITPQEAALRCLSERHLVM